MKRRLRVEPGTIFTSRKGKIYGVCAHCEQLIRIDKPILGSLHICV